MIASLRFLPLWLLTTAVMPAASAGNNPPTATLSPNTMEVDNIPQDPAAPMLKKAYEMITKGDTNGALTLVDEAVHNNPRSYAALTLRGMIHSKLKEWSQAEADFNAAMALDPTNMVVKFNLGEIRFLQKQYDVARTRFAALESDPVMGDFAAYKAYLCDLFGDHQERAAKQLAAWTPETGPSYYFGHAAWDFAVTKNETDAQSWLLSAQNIFPAGKNQFYAASLRDLGFMQPVPEAPAPAPAKPAATPDLGPRTGQ